jgi:hypothetical protein
VALRKEDLEIGASNLFTHLDVLSYDTLTLESVTTLNKVSIIYTMRITIYKTACLKIKILWLAEVLCLDH